MNIDFATAIRRALESTRAMDPAAATAIIQEALAIAPQVSHHLPDSRAPDTQGARFSLIDPSGGIADPSTRRPSDAKVRQPEPRPSAAPTPPFSIVEPKADPAPPGKGATLQRRYGPGAHTRRSLREVVEALGRGRSGGLPVTLPGMKRIPTPSVPPGARYESRSYSSAEGARDYWLYVPSRLLERPRGLVIMLHGCTQNPGDFASGTAMNAHAEKHGLLVAYPAQTSVHNASSCWNWFRPGDQCRDRGEPAIIAGITQALIAEFGVDPSHAFAAGLSAGGAMAAVMGEAYPDLYGAIGVHSGLPCGSAHDVVSAFSAMRGEAGGTAPCPTAQGSPVRTIVFHGSADGTVHPSNALRIARASEARAAGAAVRRESGTAPDGRGYERTVVVGPRGTPLSELWLIDGLGHAWSGGTPEGSYTDPAGPDASAEMIRFFLSAS